MLVRQKQIQTAGDTDAVSMQVLGGARLGREMQLTRNGRIGRCDAKKRVKAKESECQSVSEPARERSRLMDRE